MRLLHVFVREVVLVVTLALVICSPGALVVLAQASPQQGPPAADRQVAIGDQTP